VLISVEGDPPLILDLGTGLRALGDVLQPELRRLGQQLDANALLTHLHFDHMLGLPFFAPLHDPGGVLNVHGPRQGAYTLKETLLGAVQPPFFPVQMTEFRGDIRFFDTDDEDFAIGAAKIRSRSVPHPGNTLGFRIEAEGGSLAYIPDHQAPPDHRSVSEGVLELCDGVDVVIHDAQFTDGEFDEKPDWGHSTIAFAVRVAAKAGAKSLKLFHHDPIHGDDDIDKIVETARSLPEAKVLDEISAAREGETVDLGRP
jgi:phosphoribosyl 1,2-cyclic phosphodiesterase